MIWCQYPPSLCRDVLGTLWYLWWLGKRVLCSTLGGLCQRPCQRGQAVSHRHFSCLWLLLPRLSSDASLRSTAKVLLSSDCHLSMQASPQEESADGSQVERRGFNPWGLHCHQAHLTRLCSEYPEDKRHRILTTLATAHNTWGQE